MIDTFKDEPQSESGIDSSKGGTKAAAVAIGGTVAVAGAAFLSSQYFLEDDGPNVSELHSENFSVPKQAAVPVDNITTIQEDSIDNTKSNLSTSNSDSSVLQGNDEGGQTFDEAFALARTEHGGGGGHFAWRGDTYNTYTVEEWDGLSTEQRGDFLANVTDSDQPGINAVQSDLIIVPEPELHTSSELSVPYATIEHQLDDVITLDENGNDDVMIIEDVPGPELEGPDYIVNASDQNEIPESDYTIDPGNESPNHNDDTAYTSFPDLDII